MRDFDQAALDELVFENVTLSNAYNQIGSFNFSHSENKVMYFGTNQLCSFGARDVVQQVTMFGGDGAV
jgi:hypothetical protein